jgi:hypothetical protein
VIERRPLRAGLLVLGLLVGTTVAGCSSSSSDDSAPKLAEVRALLARHGAAVTPTSALDSSRCSQTW